MTKYSFLILTCLLFTTCKKTGTTIEGYFFTDVEKNPGPLFLYIDNHNKGPLPNLNTRVSPDNDTVLKQALHVTLRRGGRYKVAAKDANGNIKSEGTLIFRTNSSRGSSTIGGSTTSQIDRKFAHRLYF